MLKLDFYWTSLSLSLSYTLSSYSYTGTHRHTHTHTYTQWLSHYFSFFWFILSFLWVLFTQLSVSLTSFSSPPFLPLLSFPLSLSLSPSISLSLIPLPFTLPFSLTLYLSLSPPPLSSWSIFLQPHPEREVCWCEGQLFCPSESNKRFISGKKPFFLKRPTKKK